MKIFTDIDYRQPCDGENRFSRRLNVFTPDQDGKRPVWLFFHGGGLETGCYKDMTSNCASFFCNKDLVLVSADYRKYPFAVYPDFIEDAAAAWKWVTQNIENYGGDPGNIFISGHSAGAYLAAMTVLDKKYAAQYKLPPQTCAGLILISGQLLTHFRVKMEAGLDQQKPLINEAAPLYHLTRESPPLLSICAVDDIPSRAAENNYVVEILKTCGHNDCRYVQIADRDHTSIFEMLGNEQDHTSQEIIGFIRKYSV